MDNFFDLLRSKNLQLYQYVCSQIDGAKPRLDAIDSFFTEYTDHSTSHSNRVAKLGFALNSGNELSEYEIAVFLLSAYFHDIGMNVSETEYLEYCDALGNEVNFDAFVEDSQVRERLENSGKDKQMYFLALDSFRNNHARRSSEYINNRYRETDTESYFGNKVFLWGAVRLVCEAHTMSSREFNVSERHVCKCLVGDGQAVDVVYLSMLLRLSDVCHFSRDRAFQFIYKHLDFVSEKSKKIWEYYADIVDTCPNDENGTIDIQANCSNYHTHRAILQDAEYIQDELYNCHKSCIEKHSNFGFKWKYVDVSRVSAKPEAQYEYLDTRFRLKHGKIVNLLMGEKLYRDRFYALRECIQNAVDSIKVFSSKSPAGHHISINYHNINEPIIDVFDTGTGMTKNVINENFLSIGEKSFWYSPECQRQWSLSLADKQLIADHGIGVLSYFMIAKKIEVYSCDHWSSEKVHVFIDDFVDGVVFKKTGMQDFPNLPSSEQTSPWILNHGTCVRFRLKEEVDQKSLLGFLSKNVLRVNVPVYLTYNEKTIELPDVWHFRDSFDSHCYPKDSYLRKWSFGVEEDLATKEQEGADSFFKSFYVPAKGFYEDEPNDKSLVNNFFVEGGIRGLIHINYSNKPETPFRISQNGILIEDAVDAVVGILDPPLLTGAFGFDIDISGSSQLQLDAERARIIANGFNRTRLTKIRELLVQKYFELLAEIESPEYFVCGGNFYHGIEDVVLGNPDSLKCFNANLSAVFGNRNEKEAIPEEYMEYFFDSKLYMCGRERNRPVSVNDIMMFGDMKELLLIKSKVIKTLGRINAERASKKVQTIIDEVFQFADHQIVYLPDGGDTFIYPLLANFDFVVKKKARNYTILEILDRGSQDFMEKCRLFSS